ncbi:hypothetical protein Tco_0084738 [Tanacetum coccineum]
MPEDLYSYILAPYEVPPSPDYISGPEVPPSPDYIPGPKIHQDMFLSLIRRRDDEGCRRDPADTYDGDDDVEDENEDEDEEEEEEHLALADSVPLIHRMTARISIRDELSISLLLREEVERCSTSRELDYDITDTWDDLVGAIDEIAPTTLEGVNQRVTDLATIVEQETTSMYGIMEDAQDDREREAKMAREAWGLSMDASDYARSDVMSLRTTVVAQSALISELQSADHRRQRVISELLASDHKRQVQLTKTLRLLKGLQTQMVEFQRQHGPAKGPAQPDAPGEAGSSS